MSCLRDSFKPHCQSTSVYFSCLFQCFLSLPHVASAQPIQIRFIVLLKKKIKEKTSVPDLTASRSRLIHNAALLLTPKKWPHPDICYVQPRGLPPSLLLLKESAQMEKKWQALRRHQPCRSPLPSPCFFSPCDHICICLRAESLEIYSLKTDKDELLRLYSLGYTLSVHSCSGPLLHFAFITPF